MDWRYVWAYHRIADRGARRAEDVSSQLATLASHEWLERQPPRGRGLWEGSAWGTYSAWKTVGVKQPRNFFSPEKNLVKRLAAFAEGPLFAEAQQDFAGVFSRDTNDVAALEALGWSLTDLTYRGVVLVGWGIPKGVVWIGYATDPTIWKRTAEQRALELYFPLRPYAYRPDAPALSGEMIESPWRVLDVFPSHRRRWLRTVGTALMAATHAQRSGELVLLLPRRIDVHAARDQQAHAPRPLLAITEEVAEDAARYFPWLWYFVPTDLQPNVPPIPADDDFASIVELFIILSALRHVKTDVTINDVLACWESLTGRRDDEVAKRLTGKRLRQLAIPLDAYFIHSGLRRWLWRISEWILNVGRADLLANVDALWRGHDDQVAHELHRLQWQHLADPHANAKLVEFYLREGDLATARTIANEEGADPHLIAQYAQQLFDRMSIAWDRDPVVVSKIASFVGDFPKVDRRAPTQGGDRSDSSS